MTYTSVITNIGNVPLNNIVLQDDQTTGVTFNTGSVYINGVNESRYNPITGITLCSIAVGSSITINFSTTVTTFQLVI